MIHFSTALHDSLRPDRQRCEALFLGSVGRPRLWPNSLSRSGYILEPKGATRRSRGAHPEWILSMQRRDTSSLLGAIRRSKQL